MIVLQPELVETYLAAVKPLSIFGLRLEAFIAIDAIIISGCLFAWWQWRQNKKRAENFQKAQGHVLIEFTPDDGSIPVERVLCEVYKGIAKKIEKSGRIFHTSMYARPKSKLLDKMLDEYYLLPEHDYKDWWPYGARASQQVSITKYYCKANDPCPYLPHDASRWTDERYGKITAALAARAKDDADSEMMMKELKGAYTSIESMVAKLKYIPIILIGSLVSLLFLIITAVLAYNAGTNAEKAFNAISRYITGS